jgi:polyphosphate:AMP phosphotransferase
MFETAELGNKISKTEYKKRVPVLRRELLDLQRELRDATGFPVIIVFGGVDGAGKAQTINLLNEWMDPRWLVTRAYVEPSEEERERPEYWRFWRDLPPKGRIGLFLSSWYSQPLLGRAYAEIDLGEFDQRLERIVAFENALADDGAVVLKFWMHLSRDAQKKRLKSLQKDALTSWRVTERHWKHWKMYEQFEEAAERIVMHTSTGKATWHIVEGEDHNYRSLTVGAIIRDAIRKQIETFRLEQEVKARLQNSVAAAPAAVAPRDQGTADEKPDAGGAGAKPVTPLTVLNALDMSKCLGKNEYAEQLKKYQATLNLLHRKALRKKVSTILVFEGPDAGGKGGAIRRITAALDARNFQVIPIAAPTDEEALHHYLWRFWRHLSRTGRVTIFDRSWYGRVLVERVEGFATEDEWLRAYAEIIDFEEQLIDHGIVLVKYWLHITKDEQLARFKAREQTPYKRWKLTDEDWRNREKWDDYAMATNDMVQHTSTLHAPWTLIEGNDKRYARIRVIRTLCKSLEDKMG